MGMDLWEYFREGPQEDESMTLPSRRTRLHDGSPVRYGIYESNYLFGLIRDACEHLPEVSKIWVYGSYAKNGRARKHSDIDIIARLEGPEEEQNPEDLERALEKELRKVVNVILDWEYDESDFKRMSNVERTKVLVYEKKEEGQ